MIEQYREEHLESVLQIWLDASILAHSFMPSSYWEERVEDMRNIYIPASETYVYLSEDSAVIGFISLVDSYIAAIFVSPDAQGKGVGKQLINHAKTMRLSLGLGVYEENTDSVAFYKKQGFVVVEEKIEEHTGHKELVMNYEK